MPSRDVRRSRRTKRTRHGDGTDGTGNRGRHITIVRRNTGITARSTRTAVIIRKRREPARTRLTSQRVGDARESSSSLQIDLPPARTENETEDEEEEEPLQPSMPMSTMPSDESPAMLSQRLREVIAELHALKACCSGPRTDSGSTEGMKSNDFLSILKVGDGVVELKVARAQINIAKPWMQPVPGAASGTGWFVQQSGGYILTNYHVIESQKLITVHVNSQRECEVQAKVVAASPSDDVALLQITDASMERLGRDNIIPLPLGDSTRLKPLSGLVSIGNPFGQQQKVISGDLSGWNEALDKYLAATTVPINSGNSGGPLFSVADGRVVGIAVAAVVGANSLTYMIPMQRIKAILPDLFHRASEVRSKTKMQGQTATASTMVYKHVLPFQTAKLDKHSWDEMGLEDRKEGVEILSIVDRTKESVLRARDILVALDITFHDLTDLDANSLAATGGDIGSLPMRVQRVTFPKRTGITVWDRVGPAGTGTGGEWQENHISQLRNVELQEYMEYMPLQDLQIVVTFYRQGKEAKTPIRMIIPPKATKGAYEIYPDLQPVEFMVVFGLGLVYMYNPFLKFMKCVKDSAYERAPHVIVTQVFPSSHCHRSNKVDQLDELIAIEYGGKVYPVSSIQDVIQTVTTVLTECLRRLKADPSNRRAALVRLDFRHEDEPKSILIDIIEELNADTQTYQEHDMTGKLPAYAVRWHHLLDAYNESQAARSV